VKKIKSLLASIQLDIKIEDISKSISLKKRLNIGDKSYPVFFFNGKMIGDVDDVVGWLERENKNEKIVEDDISNQQKKIANLKKIFKLNKIIIRTIISLRVIKT